MTNGGRDQTAWPWAVLLLVVGVLAMHGLVSTDHAAHRTSTSMSMAAQADASAMSPVPAHDGPADLAALAVSADADLREVVVSAVGLCLAVLLGAALLHPSRRGWSFTRPSRLVTLPSMQTSPPGRGPPRLLLAQLCVLRT